MTDSSVMHREPDKRHGGKAGWYRVATGLALLAALEMAFSAWRAVRTHTTADSPFRPELAPYFVCATVALCVAAALAARRRSVAGLFVVLAYALPAIALYRSAGLAAGPSLLMFVVLFALLMPTLRRVGHSDPAI